MRSRFVIAPLTLMWSMGISCSEGGKVTVDEAALPEESTPLEQEDTSTSPDPVVEPSTDSEPEDTANDTGTEEDTGIVEIVNLLQNPGFEDGDSPWNIWGGAQRVEGESQDGNWSIMATNGNGAEQLVEGLTPNTTYRLSGWGKTAGEQGISIGVKSYGGSQKVVNFTEESYTEDSLTFSTGLSNTSAVIFAYKHTGEVAGYADNLVLTETGESPYTIVWADEFDGEGPPDASKWTFEEGFVRNQEQQWYQSENAFQQDGFLIIEGREEQKANPNYIPGSNDWRTSREFIEYTSASVKTQGLFEWQYGRMVVRAKVSNLEGTWPAIWMLGIDCDWPSNGEIDIMENYGGEILGNFAWGSNQPWTPVWDVVRWDVSSLDPDWVDQFHLWELVWNQNKMTIYLDGVELNSVNLADTINGNGDCPGQNPFQQPHYILLNLALGGTAGGSVENLSFPTQYLIDYVRVYQ